MIRANQGRLLIVILSVLAALGGHLDAFPWLPLGAQHALELGGYIAAIVSALLVNPSATLPEPKQ